MYYYGARYYDAQLSRWISADPALEDSKYFPEPQDFDTEHGYDWYYNHSKEANLPGLGGVFNPVNLDLYHYAGNNPVKFIDPDGNWFIIDDTLTGPVDEIIVIGGLTIAAALGSEWAQEKKNQLSKKVSAMSTAVTMESIELQAKLYGKLTQLLNEDKAKEKVDEKIDGVVEGKEAGRKTKGRTKQFVGEGGMDEADKDFDSLSPTNVKPLADGKGRTGVLEDGSKVNVRTDSSDGRPTLEVQRGKNKIKIRYDEK